LSEPAADQKAEKKPRPRFGPRFGIGRSAILAETTTQAAVLLLRQWRAAVPAPLGEVLPEGLLILAWVALWRPIETIGCDLWEGRQ